MKIHTDAELRSYAKALATADIVGHDAMCKTPVISSLDLINELLFVKGLLKEVSTQIDSRYTMLAKELREKCKDASK